MTFAFDRVMRRETPAFGWERELPSTEALLALGGDARIVPAGAQGRNRYGRRTAPEDGVAAFGSCTASTVSRAGFAEAERRREALLFQLDAEPPEAVYTREADRLRGEIGALFAPGSDAEVVLTASGTDLHLLVSQLLAAEAGATPLVLMGEAAETGSGVPAALAGRRFGAGAPFPRAVAVGADEHGMVPGGAPCEIVHIPSRDTPAAVEAAIESLSEAALRAGRRMLIVLADVSKSGRITPGLGAALALKRRHPDEVELLVDACQGRLAPSTVSAYLGCGALVAVTGSKFLGGPAFSAALLVPPAAAARLRGRSLPEGLSGHSARADWPAGWAAGATLRAGANFGLLLRWSAAIEELRAFRALTEDEVAGFLAGFAMVVGAALDQQSNLELLPQGLLQRPGLGAPPSWDRVPSIFTFALRHDEARGGALFDPAEAALAHKLLQTGLSGFSPVPAADLRVELGQPVTLGRPDGTPAAGLRLCASAPLIVEALAGGLGARRRVMDRARAAVAMTAAAVHFVSESGSAS